MPRIDDEERVRTCVRHRWVVYEPGDTCPECEDERTDPIPREEREGR